MTPLTTSIRYFEMPKPRKVDRTQLARAYRAGERLQAIADRFGVTRSAIKFNLREMKIRRRLLGWKPAKEL